MPTTIRRKVRLRPNQMWTSKILTYMEDKPYYDYRVVEYDEGVWESEDLMEAGLGTLNPGETPRYIYDHAVMTEDEYDEWTTMSGTGGPVE